MIGRTQIRTCLTRDHLRLILMPTEACNFRCSYCYEEFRHGRMKPEVVRGVKNLLENRSPGLKRLQLSWFGGEPLLAMDIVDDVMTRALKIRDRGDGLDLVSDMTTNAYRLKRDVFERLLELEVKEYQITLDGPREWHERKRMRAGGQPSFDTIWENLVGMSRVSAQFEVTLRIHIDRENHSSISELLEEIRSTFGNDPRFRVYLRRVARLGGPRNDELPVLEPKVAYPILETLRERAVELGLTSEIGTGNPGICYAVNTNMFLVRSDGRLNKCTVALDHPRNQVGRLTADGEIAFDRSKSGFWTRGLVSKRLEELQCPMHGIEEVHSAGGA